MATIVIKDLPENTELDRDAMRAVMGGARLRGRTGSQPSKSMPTRLVQPRAGHNRPPARHAGKPV